MYTIQSTQHLKELFSDLIQQGFAIDSTVVSKAIQAKLLAVVQRANKLKLVENEEQIIKDALANYSDFADLERVIYGYFNRKTPEDRIKQIIVGMGLRATDTIDRPFSNDPPRKWETYRAQLVKYGLQEENLNIEYRCLWVYDLTKKTIRISRLKDYRANLAQLAQLITGEDAKTLSYDSPTGQWLPVCKSIEVKFYKDDSGDLRGNIDQIKQYYKARYEVQPSSVIVA